MVLLQHCNFYVITMNINNTLNALMREKNIKWKELSEILKIGKNQFRYWEEKDTLPDGKTLIKLSKFFGVSTDYLLGLTDNSSPYISAQEKTLLDMFRETSEEGRFRMIQAVMNIKDEVEKKRNTASDQGFAG